MSTAGTPYDEAAFGGQANARDRSRELLGQVMGLVAVAVGFAALGAYLGRDLSGATGLVLFIGAFACIVGLNVAAAKRREPRVAGGRSDRGVRGRVRRVRLTPSPGWGSSARSPSTTSTACAAQIATAPS
jgi:hypothetical protein